MKSARAFTSLAVIGLLSWTIGCTGGTVAESKTAEDDAKKAAQSEGLVDSQADAMLAELVPGYLRLMDSLADDSLESAVASAQELEGVLRELDPTAPGVADLTLAAAGIRQATDIVAARAEFAELSKTMIPLWRSAQEKHGTVVAHCPMAAESWLQTDAPLSNPYYGSEMLRCGEITER